MIITFSFTNDILFSAFRDDKIDSVSDYEPVKHHSYGSKYSDFDTLGSPGKIIVTLVCQPFLLRAYLHTILVRGCCSIH